MLTAQKLDNIQSSAFQGNTIPQDVGGLIGAVLPYVFGASAIALLIYLVTAGLQMMLSKGDSKAMQIAQGRMTNAILGFVIVAVSFLIVRIVGQLLGIDAFRPIFGF